MTRCRVIVAVEALALLGILVWALARPVTAARGRDEIDYRHLQPLLLHSGQLLRQPMPLQQDHFSGVAIPYQLQGTRSAEIRVLLLDAEGRSLADSRIRLAPTKVLDFITVHVDGGTSSAGVLVAVERWDQGSSDLNLAAYPTADTGRPSMLQQPDTTLALQTLYGAWGPAVLKAQLYADRVASLAPPWFPLPVDLVLVALFLMLGLDLLVLIGIDRGDPEGSPIMARELAPTDAIPDRDRDPRLP